MNAHTIIVGTLVLSLLYTGVCFVYRTIYRDAQPGLQGCDWFIASQLTLAVAIAFILSSPQLPSSLASLPGGLIRLLFVPLVLASHLLLHKAFAELLEEASAFWISQLCLFAVGLVAWACLRQLPLPMAISSLIGLVWGAQYGVTGLLLLHKAPDTGSAAARFAAGIMIGYALCHLFRFETATIPLGIRGAAAGRFLPALILLIHGAIAFGFLLVACSRLTMRLELDAHVDELTGLKNRRALRLAAARAIAHCRHTEGQLSVLMIDLDGMKDANDRLGHGAGDALLCAVARTLRDLMRKTDCLARIGGDEFCLLLPGTSEAEASSIADLYRTRITEIEVDYHGERIQARASFGVACAAAGSMDWEEMLRVSDLALYRAKGEGGNRVAVGSTPASELRSWKSAAAWAAASTAHRRFQSGRTVAGS